MLLSSMLADSFIQDVINRKPQAPLPPGSGAGTGALLPGAAESGGATPSGSGGGAGDPQLSPAAAGPTGAISFTPAAAGPTGASVISSSTSGGGAGGPGGSAAATMGVGERISDSGGPSSEEAPLPFSWRVGCRNRLA